MPTCLKFDEGIQRVRVPSGQRLASRPVASLAWTGATRAAKRRQQASGPRERAPKGQFVGPTTLSCSEGRIDLHRDGEEQAGPPGSRSGARWQGFPRNLGDPITSVADERLGSRTPKPRPAGADAVPDGCEQGEQAEPTAQGKRGGRRRWEVGALHSTEEAGEPSRGIPWREGGAGAETRRRERRRRCQAPQSSQRNSNG